MLNRFVRASSLVVLAGGVLAGCAASPPPVSGRLDDADRAAIRLAVQQALETAKLGQGVGWENPASGHRGTVTPLRTIETAGAAPCRDYQIAAAAGDDTAVGADRACRQADGAWISESWDDPADILRAAERRRDNARRAYGDPWCAWPHRGGYDPWCRWPYGSGVSVGIGSRF